MCYCFRAIFEFLSQTTIFCFFEVDFIDFEFDLDHNQGSRERSRLRKLSRISIASFQESLWIFSMNWKSKHLREGFYISKLKENVYFWFWNNKHWIIERECSMYPKWIKIYKGYCGLFQDNDLDKDQGFIHSRPDQTGLSKNNCKLQNCIEVQKDHLE